METPWFLNHRGLRIVAAIWGALTGMAFLGLVGLGALGGSAWDAYLRYHHAPACATPQQTLASDCQLTTSAIVTNTRSIVGRSRDHIVDLDVPEVGARTASFLPEPLFASVHPGDTIRVRLWHGEITALASATEEATTSRDPTVLAVGLEAGGVIVACITAIFAGLFLLSLGRLRAEHDPLPRLQPGDAVTTQVLPTTASALLLVGLVTAGVTPLGLFLPIGIIPDSALGAAAGVLAGIGFALLTRRLRVVVSPSAVTVLRGSKILRTVPLADVLGLRVDIIGRSRQMALTTRQGPPLFLPPLRLCTTRNDPILRLLSHPPRAPEPWGGAFTTIPRSRHP